MISLLVFVPFGGSLMRLRMHKDKVSNIIIETLEFLPGTDIYSLQ